MPWTAPSGNTYQLCLLDTNVISEIVKRPTREGRNFIIRYSPNVYIPCLTIYSVIELRRKPEIFNAYVDFFSIYPHVLLKLFQHILEEEARANGKLDSSIVLFNAFTPLGRDKSYELRQFTESLFRIPDIRKVEKKWRANEEDVYQTWLRNKVNFESSGRTVNARDADRYVRDAGVETLARLIPEWVKKELDAGRIPDLDNFPSLKVMLYSQYYRIFDADRKPFPQDVTDIEIMAAAPYMDVVITERFQAEILRKIKSKIPMMSDIKIATLRDLR